MPYLQVTIADGADGAIDFTVQVLDAADRCSPPRISASSHSRSTLIPGGDAEGASVGNLPVGWITRDHYRMSEFGFFDIKLYGGGNSRLQTLTFSILGIDGDTPAGLRCPVHGQCAGWPLPSSRRAWPTFSCPNARRRCPTSAFFAGNAPVPLPGAAWLFATGAAAVVARARSANCRSGFSRDSNRG